MRPNLRFAASVLTVIALSISLVAQELDKPDQIPDWAKGSLIEFSVDELRIRLVPLDLETLKLLRSDLMAQVRISASELADAIVARLKLAKAGVVAEQEINEVGGRTILLMTKKQGLIARASLLLEAIAEKGGDVSVDRAYLESVKSLRPDLAATVAREQPKPGDTSQSSERMRARVAELVAMVAAEPPIHERKDPWTVPLSEFELELRPLTTEQILERLQMWQALLQQQVRKRIRMDILLHDIDKLKRNLEVRNQAAMLVGLSTDDASVDELKAALAAQVEAQQQVIVAITDRMKVAIEIVKRRGGDAEPYIEYIASATGRKLNFTDFSILRVQVAQWITSPSGGRLIAINALLFVGIVALFRVIGRFAGLFTRYASRRIPRSSSLLGPVLAGVVEKVTLLVGVVVAASAVGVDTGPLLAMIGATGLVIGLALQGTLSNFASGILILLTRPFDVGDVVDAGGVYGKVEVMNLVSTTILTFDNQLMLVPNNQIWNSVITNVTGKDTRRVDLTFGIAYSSEIGKATDILEELLNAHPKTLDEPKPVVRVHELADSSVNLIARPWVQTADYWDVYWDLMRQVKERFDEEGVSIPFPQRDLNVADAIEVRLSRRETMPQPASKRRRFEEKLDDTYKQSTHEPGPAVNDVDQPIDPDEQTDSGPEAN